ncbi:unnamed protein product, partial [Nesidiocoris tenuis]
MNFRTRESLKAEPYYPRYRLPESLPEQVSPSDSMNALGVVSNQSGTVQDWSDRTNLMVTKIYEANVNIWYEYVIVRLVLNVPKLNDFLYESQSNFLKKQSTVYSSRLKAELEREGQIIQNGVVRMLVLGGAEGGVLRGFQR